MFSIDIFSEYEIVETINDCYKSYDSDADDWFKHDSYVNEYTLNAIDLINHINQKLNVNLSELCDFKINTTIDNHLKLEIQTFNPSDGTGTDYIYIIKRVLKSKGE